LTAGLSSGHIRRGLRWVHAGADSLTFLRESPGARVLVHAARATHGPVRLSSAELGMEEAASHLLGGADTVVRDGRASLPADGPAFHAWRMENGRGADQSEAAPSVSFMRPER
jgi:alpha-glucosidase